MFCHPYGFDTWSWHNKMLIHRIWNITFTSGPKIFSMFVNVFNKQQADVSIGISTASLQMEINYIQKAGHKWQQILEHQSARWCSISRVISTMLVDDPHVHPHHSSWLPSVQAYIVHRCHALSNPLHLALAFVLGYQIWIGYHQDAFKSRWNAPFWSDPCQTTSGGGLGHILTNTITNASDYPIHIFCVLFKSIGKEMDTSSSSVFPF